MAAQQGVPGIAVGMAGAAAVLMYAGFRGVSPIAALREVATGKPAGLAEQSSAHQALYTGLGSAAAGGGGGAGGGVADASLIVSGGTHAEIARAALGHSGELYSQARRWQPGYSDCSSFAGKALKDAGISPPGGSTTGSYLVWSKLTKISRASIGAGDLLVSSGHMAIALSSTTAIGQQNARVNVQSGPIDSIMWGQPGWVALRYTGGAGSVSV